MTRVATCKRNRRSEICGLEACVRTWQLPLRTARIRLVCSQLFNWIPTARLRNTGTFEVSSATSAATHQREAKEKAKTYLHQRLNTPNATRQACFSPETFCGMHRNSESERVVHVKSSIHFMALGAHERSARHLDLTDAV